MDALSLQYANALCGNASCTAALEITLRGPRLQFHRAATVAVCGGKVEVTLASGGCTTTVPMWENFRVAAGDVVSVGIMAQGVRSYMAVDGGFDAPLYLGSRSTFPSGKLGGYQGRPLQVLSGNCLTRHVVTIEINCAYRIGSFSLLLRYGNVLSTHCRTLHAAQGWANNQRLMPLNVWPSGGWCNWVECELLFIKHT